MQFFSPKNFKKGRLIALKYRILDILIFLCGSLFSLIIVIGYFTLFNKYNIFILLLLLLPAAISIILTMIPFEVYHNLFEYLNLRIKFKRSQKNFIWEGIYKYDEE